MQSIAPMRTAESLYVTTASRSVSSIISAIDVRSGVKSVMSPEMALLQTK